MVCFILIFSHDCQSKSGNSGNNEDSKRSIETELVQESKIDERSSDDTPKSDAEKIKIVAHLTNARAEEQDREYLLPVDTTRLIIGGHPLTITNIRGLEQLKTVTYLYLYAINKNTDDVLDAIKVLGVTVEIIVCQNCSLKNLDFLKYFPNLKVILYGNGRLESCPYFDFTVNKNLEYFFWYNSTFESSVEVFRNEQFDIGDLTADERKSITLMIEPSPSMKMLVVDTNMYPLIINTDLLKKLENIDYIYFSQSMLVNGGNDMDLLQQFRNVRIYANSMIAPEEEIPNRYRYKTLLDTTSFEIIGAR